MPEHRPPRDIHHVQRTQVQYIIDEFARAGTPVQTEPPDWADDRENPAPVKFLYRQDHLLVRDQDLGKITSLGDVSLKRRKVRLDRAEMVGHPVPGLALVNVPLEADVNLMDVLAQINERVGAHAVTPETVLSISIIPPPATHCPATEPDGVPAGARPLPAVAAGRCDGRGVLVAIADTGLLKKAPREHPWLHGVTGRSEPSKGPIDPADPAKPRFIPRYAGHGTFIASVVRAMAPRAEVRVGRIFERAGACFESEVVKALYRLMDSSPDIISLSAGTHTWLDRGLLSFRVFIDGPLRDSHKTVLVAAAGNDGQDWRFSPAMMRGVVSVGALASNEETRAWFTNYGDWVKVYAPGEDLVHAYAHGTYRYFETQGRPDQPFDGMARWSGTSFSTPVVAGLIAARMSGTGETAREAARSLLALARAQALPGVGPVLRPGQACLGLKHRSRCQCGRQKCGCQE
jgi:hypothetical protein